ncbi:transcriptional regulator BetI [Ruegeria sp. THAF57]|uniref:TetR/AcrR family transcriptional regulator n=1 Tax=Ruegeria sp. THAF57 TaxID=2744555 RepID=UPI001480BEE9|nr:TetR/AcrR family transcriptional regulator [Ruegeria sp. THAF57]CAD0185131.1 transcriptional regulator BetI [Ruegeria sp. THAF57]
METHELQKKRRTEPPEVRRLQLIMAAIDSISKRGFSDTTLKHVTETANLSHGVVNYHFDSKEALYDAALGFLAQEHYENWLKSYDAAEPTAAHRLAAIIRADFDKSICTHKRLAVWFAFWGQAKYRPNYLKIHNKYDNERYERILELCGELIADGGYDDLDPEKTARAVEAMSDGAWLSLMLYPKVADRREFRDVCMLSLSRFFPKHFPV